MRNEYIGTSIDGDACAACQTRTTGCGCGCARQHRYSAPEGQRTPVCTRCGNENCTCQNRNSCGSDCCQANTCTRCGQENCNCQARSGNCRCNDECHQARRCDSCGNENCTCQAHSGSCRYNNCSGQTPAMVYAAHHDLESAYCAEKALLRGTLFGCLDKPMCHEHCADNPCMTQCQADMFAIWELRLYLNTHPCDQQALALMRKFTACMDENCACTYTPDCGTRWSWTEGPWPWEYQHCCGKEA